MTFEVWLEKIIAWTEQQMSGADSGHGIDHVRRVVTNATSIAQQENAKLQIVVPAAWLHDCVFVPKNSPDRSRASQLAADSAGKFLSSIHFPAELIQPIQHSIAAHSFSAGIACQTLEACVVQDADRLEAVGAIGIARCLMTGGAMKQRLYHPDDPFPIERTPADTLQSIDHFFAKLLKLEKTMKTTAGRQLALERTQFMSDFLFQLADELGVDRRTVKSAIDQARAGG
ncbi:MAG: HD domain-containing protein [Pirellulales bacterium]